MPPDWLRSRTPVSPRPTVGQWPGVESDSRQGNVPRFAPRCRVPTRHKALYSQALMDVLRAEAVQFVDEVLGVGNNRLKTGLNLMCNALDAALCAILLIHRAGKNHCSTFGSLVRYGFEFVGSLLALSRLLRSWSAWCTSNPRAAATRSWAFKDSPGALLHRQSASHRTEAPHRVSPCTWIGIA